MLTGFPPVQHTNQIHKEMLIHGYMLPKRGSWSNMLEEHCISLSQFYISTSKALKNPAVKEFI